MLPKRRRNLADGQAPLCPRPLARLPLALPPFASAGQWHQAGESPVWPLAAEAPSSSSLAARGLLGQLAAWPLGLLTAWPLACPSPGVASARSPDRASYAHIRCLTVLEARVRDRGATRGPVPGPSPAGGRRRPRLRPDAPPRPLHARAALSREHVCVPTPVLVRTVVLDQGPPAPG